MFEPAPPGFWENRPPPGFNWKLSKLKLEPKIRPPWLESPYQTLVGGKYMKSFSFGTLTLLCLDLVVFEMNFKKITSFFLIFFNEKIENSMILFEIVIENFEIPIDIFSFAILYIFF